MNEPMPYELVVNLEKITTTTKIFKMEKDIKVLRAIEALSEEGVINKAQATTMWQKYISKKLAEETEARNRLNQ